MGLEKEMLRNAYFRKVFEFVDKDNDEPISTSDLTRTIKEVSGKTWLDEDIDEMMSRITHDGKPTISFEVFTSILETRIDEHLNEPEIDLTYEICVDKFGLDSSKDVIWENEDKSERKLSIKALRNAVQFLLDEDGEISEDEVAATIAVFGKSNINNKISKLEFSKMVSAINKDAFVSFSSILMDLDGCSICILRSVYIFAKLLPILNNIEKGYTIDDELKNLTLF